MAPHPPAGELAQLERREIVRFPGLRALLRVTLYEWKPVTSRECRSAESAARFGNDLMI